MFIMGFTSLDQKQPQGFALVICGAVFVACAGVTYDIVSAIKRHGNRPDDKKGTP